MKDSGISDERISYERELGRMFHMLVPKLFSGFGTPSSPILPLIYTLLKLTINQGMIDYKNLNYWPILEPIHREREREKSIKLFTQYV